MMVSGNGVSFTSSQDLLEHIPGIKPPFQTTTTDSLGWLWSENSGFSVKSTYDERCNYPIGLVDNVWGVLKKFQGVPQVKSFLWLPWRTWTICFDGGRLRRYFSASESDWDILFGVILWNLWLSRNRRIFDPESDQIDNVMGCSRQLRDDTCRALTSATMQSSILGGACPLVVKWCLPSVDSIKVNVDGDRRLHGVVASCGGIVRNSNGVWLDGFTKFIGKCSFLEAELWVVCQGLKCAMDMNVQKVIMESDSREVICTLLGQGWRATSSSLLESIRSLASGNCEVVFQHVFREGNRVADAMTRFFSMDTFATRLYLYPPDEVLEILHADVCT
ncbi:hypothetical protein V6N12_065407 [Hibiscus sabdariffa]|uniref:RNase H type-1 domain-containing protein n=1 Tax=Hibiscus sabdariffa TaxID=183260 RepID=A0ABR2G9M8_9ROSI